MNDTDAVVESPLDFPANDFMEIEGQYVHI